MNIVHAVHGRSAINRKRRRHHCYGTLDDSSAHFQQGAKFRAKVAAKSRIDLFKKEDCRIRRMHLDKLSQPFCCGKSESDRVSASTDNTSISSSLEGGPSDTLVLRPALAHAMPQSIAPEKSSANISTRGVTRFLRLSR